ncbi:MAG: ABC transporter permease [Prevotella sp.]|nr:ABC transporter permease [Bacteroides sp.]MCM1365610.1 ABC transporter permease [Prevotella sp.]
MSNKNRYNNLRQLRIIVANEYMTDIRSKGFWITTIALPLAMGLFSFFIGMLAKDSTVLQSIGNPSSSNMNELSGHEIMSMLTGMFLTLFIMLYGAQIFNKVKQEKCNRIVEILATCVEGRIMMFAKIISVALIGLTQILFWFILLGLSIWMLILVFIPEISLISLKYTDIFISFTLSVLYFIGGYLLYGSLYAAAGAMTDKNNENQEYMTILTFILLGSFYIGQFAVENFDSPLTVWCQYIPFTSPTIGAINATSGHASWWHTVISLLILYSSALLSITISGKIYRTSILLTGKKFSPRDIITFFRAK